MRDGKNGYAPSPGIPEALEAIRGEAARKGIRTVQRCLCHFRGKRDGGSVPVGAAEPWRRPADAEPGLSACIPLYSASSAIRLNAYDLNEEDGWQPELADIERKLTPRTRGIVLINPNNPTGSLCTREMLEQHCGTGAPPQSDRVFRRDLRQADSRWHSAHCLRFRCARRALHYVRRHVEELSCPRMAHRMGHRLRRCGRWSSAIPKVCTDCLRATTCAPIIPSSMRSNPRWKARRTI